MSNAHDKLTFLPHRINKFHGVKARIICFTKLFGCTIKGTSKSLALEKKKEKHINMHFIYNSIYKP